MPAKGDKKKGAPAAEAPAKDEPAKKGTKEGKKGKDSKK